MNNLYEIKVDSGTQKNKTMLVNLAEFYMIAKNTDLTHKISYTLTQSKLNSYTF